MAKLGQDISKRLESIVLNATTENTAQERFNSNYVTAIEIMERLNVTRPTVILKMRGRFPTIKIGNTYIWERTPQMEQFLEAWDYLRNRGE